MYVCICNSVTDRDIAEAVRNGAQTLTDLEVTLGVGTCCGQCRGKASECLRRLQGAQVMQPIRAAQAPAPNPALALSA